MKIAGLDIGTTGCKCTVFDENGKYLDRSYRDYPVRRELSGHEINAGTVLKEVYSAVLEMARKYPDIAGLGVTSFGETFILADENGEALAPSMLYTDPRGTEECGRLADSLGEKEIARITGLRPHTMYSIGKLVWMKEHRPEIFERARYIFLMEDFVVYHLTGERKIDYSLASRTMAFDIHTLSFSDEILKTAGIDKALFSHPVPTGTIAGEVTASAAEKCGLKQGTKVVSISHDQVAAAVGAGAFDAETAVDGAGTVECLTPIYDRMPDTDAMYQGYFSVVPYVRAGTYVAYAFSYAGGALIQWCIDGFAGGFLRKAKERDISVNTLLEEEYRKRHGDEPSGLLVLPHITGAATPYMDNGSRGAVLGLNAGTTAIELYRGCMEGVAYEMYLNLQALKDTGVHFKKLHATGGGARSGEWMQIKADVLDLPITSLKTSDAGTVGSAMLTGVALGVFKDLPDAARHMVEEMETYEPRRAMHEKYMAIYTRYKEVYNAVRPLV